jgi:hypothetical protein
MLLRRESLFFWIIFENIYIKKVIKSITKEKYRDETKKKKTSLFQQKQKDWKEKTKSRVTD